MKLIRKSEGVFEFRYDDGVKLGEARRVAPGEMFVFYFENHAGYFVSHTLREISDKLIELNRV